MTPLQQAAQARDLDVLDYLRALVRASKPMLTQAALGAEMGLNREQIEDSMKRLRRAKLITVERWANRYRVIIGDAATDWSAKVETPQTITEDAPRARADHKLRSCLSRLSSKCEGVVFGGPGQRRCEPCHRVTRDLETPFDSNPGGGGRRVTARTTSSSMNVAIAIRGEGAAA